MEDLRPLTVVCKHLRSETLDETVNRLSKQKHAAHTQTCRLRKKTRELQLAVHLLSAMWLNVERQNTALRQQMQQYVQEAIAD